MTRYMYDSVEPGAIPTSATMVAGYVSGRYAWSSADWNRFPHARWVRIATQSYVNDGHVLDVEQGDASPGQAPGWVVMRRNAGVDPTVYCNNNSLSTVQQAFRDAGVPQPHYWVARYDADATIPSGCVAKQYLWDGQPCNSGGHYDISAVVDYWPGVDPVTKPAPPKEIPDVNLTDNITYTSREDGQKRTRTVAQCLAMAADLFEMYAPGYSNVGPQGRMAELQVSTYNFAQTASTKPVTVDPAAIKAAITEALAGAQAAPADAVAEAVMQRLAAATVTSTGRLA